MGSTTARERTVLEHCNICGHGCVKLFIRNDFQIVECRDCGHVFVQNPPSDEWLRSFYETLYSADSSEIERWHAKLAVVNADLVEAHAPERIDRKSTRL